ncbi:hypothetical protein Pse7367_2151 [Thalassoporum mexicanum PCC 7367]|uniref:SxtJ family membrane protein n=1 Tax=Thalassoporum mexicanum TaxID=3457544 RepID=UPI00029F9F7B|nr:SxtJ family membrane protein [Pseudanabaena sp. PCC 7367]AFY70415.1 hypothetical protein Pse7367_2151 [Pseudanabaena sp. PCC 7367]
MNHKYKYTETTEELTTKELRQFGLIMAAIAAGLFGLILPWLKQHPSPLLAWIIAAIMFSLAIVAPVALRPIYRIWMKIGEVMGWLNTRIILGIIFYLLVTPMGIFMRWLGNNDPMQRQLDDQRSTYRIASPESDRSKMAKPY